MFSIKSLISRILLEISFEKKLPELKICQFWKGLCYLIRASYADITKVKSCLPISLYQFDFFYMDVNT